VHGGNARNPNRKRLQPPITGFCVTHRARKGRSRIRTFDFYEDLPAREAAPQAAGACYFSSYLFFAVELGAADGRMTPVFGNA